ncbi:MAG TPA: phosphoribosylglycinamide formyltransferase [Gaiellales bacterium]|nr:phosphoribosylglycinamide formyltransferase [Gaiellales bacterium]
MRRRARVGGGRPAGGGTGRHARFPGGDGGRGRGSDTALRIGVLISGEGTNLQALIDAADIDVACVVSSRPDARGIERAAGAGIPAVATADEAETAAFLDGHEVELVVLAGYMRILSPEFVGRYSGRIMNVHPSLLPAFPGRTPIADALAHGVKVTGVTVHLVDDGVDTGPVVLQEAVAVRDDDDWDSLEPRIHEVEHRLLPRAVRAMVDGRIAVDGRRVTIREERT